jgi:hypothetical protein
VVLNVRSPEITTEDLNIILDSFAKNDDVFQPDFAEEGILILQCLRKTSNSGAGEEAQFYVRQASETIQLETSSQEIPEGPYFLRDSSLYQAWRLYEDHLSAFVTTVVPSDSASDRPGQPRYVTF